MITLKQESVLLKKIKSLSELEFNTLFEEVAMHVKRNDWEHIIEQHFDLTSRLEDKEEEIEDLKSDIDDTKDALATLQDNCSDAVEILEDLENIDDDIQVDIDKVINLIS